MSNDHIYPSIGHEFHGMNLVVFTWVNGERLEERAIVSPRRNDIRDEQVITELETKLRVKAEAHLVEHQPA